ncbi:hypothetical protein XENTR_v10014884 [Xenopus tropicalis]|nr:hypothetical protein XENTR_v10014884 [Xenopus tropicalis]
MTKILPPWIATYQHFSLIYQSCFLFHFFSGIREHSVVSLSVSCALAPAGFCSSLLASWMLPWLFRIPVQVGTCTEVRMLGMHYVIPCVITGAINAIIVRGFQQQETLGYSHCVSDMADPMEEGGICISVILSVLTSSDTLLSPLLNSSSAHFFCNCLNWPLGSNISSEDCRCAVPSCNENAAYVAENS